MDGNGQKKTSRRAFFKPRPCSCAKALAMCEQLWERKNRQNVSTCKSKASQLLGIDLIRGEEGAQINRLRPRSHISFLGFRQNDDTWSFAKSEVIEKIKETESQKEMQGLDTNCHIA